MTDLLEYIKKMQEMYGEDVITTADKINRPDPKPIVQEIEAFNEFNIRNPKADGGQLVAPSVDGSRPGYGGTPTKGVMSIGEYAGQPFARHRGDELPRGSIRISPDRIVFTGEDAQKNIDRFFNNRLSDKEFKKLRNQNKNLSNKEFLELIKKDYVNVRGGEWKELAVDQKTSALTNIRKTELVQPIDDPQRLKDIKKYFKDYKKQNKKFPTVQEAENYFQSKLGKQIRPSILLAAKEANIDLPSGYIGQKLKVDRDIEKLLNRKTIIDTLEAGKFPTESQIQTILKSTRTTASTRQVDLANYLAGNVKPEIKTNITVPTKYKNIATTAINNLELVKEGQFGPRKTRTRTYNEKKLAKILGIDSFQILRQDILNKIYNVIPELKGLLSVDEIGSLTAGARTNSPYTIFGQVLGKDFNKYTKSTAIDKSKSLLEKKLITLAKDDPQRLIELEKYNKKVDGFEQMANKNNPAKKVKGMKLSFEPPSKAIKNKKVYNQYKDLFDAHYEKYGYSFEVDKDTDSLTDILKKLDNKSFQNEIKNNFKGLVNRPGPRGGKIAIATALATLAGTGFALAGEEDALSKFSTGEKLAGAGATTAAAGTLGTKTGRNILGKGFRTLGTRAAALPLAGYTIYDNLKKGENIVDATLDPFVGAELMFPNLFKENVAKITSNPTLQKILKVGKYGRMFTPVGAGITALGLGIDAYKYGKKRIAELQAMSPEERAELAQQRDDFSFGEYSGAADGGLIGDKSGPAPTGGPMSQGLRSLYNNGKKL
jgi:hypothetical protein